MKRYINIMMVSFLALFVFAACIKDLDKFPANDKTKKDVYADAEGYKMALAKVYGCMTLSGNQGPAGSPDASGLDEGGNGDFLRCFFNHQEMPTDEVHCIWSDPGVPELNNLSFVSTCAFTTGLYNKSLLQISYANDFLLNCTESELATHDLTSAEQTEIGYYAAEARFLRAFQYWILMDVFGNPPFFTEADELGGLPRQISRSDLFDYVESELLDLVNNNLLKAPKANEYGRVDMAGAYALLARLYLNANVYKSPVGSPGDNTEYYTKALTYANMVLNSGYSLKTSTAGSEIGVYESLFLNDNNKNNPEVIFSLNYDGLHSKSYGGITFLINCASNGDYQKDSNYRDKLWHYGIFTNANWAGYRARGEFSDKFTADDKRYLFIGKNKSLGDYPLDYTYGMATYKYRNISSTLTRAQRDTVLKHRENEVLDVFGNDPNGEFADNDYPLFRLAEIYLIYAEAVKRGGSGGNEGTALGYLNELRSRAGLSNIGSYDLNYILDERARELYWECQRRTDLVRYNRFTTNDYIWEWKGGVKSGQSVDAYFNIYPIPLTDLQANTNLKQNTGY
ncbi:MAG: RagB/SusD family nutrient uptake outer membrane protein [Bacteroidales bacterium]|nr:RagB/SusD family nutrient uptake outer membrane protein [Bacteroidales bacterium]